MMNPDKESLSVSQLNQLIQEVLNLGFPQSLWICGEIQGFDRNRDKRHIFFELCEKDPRTKDIIARIGLVIFSGKKASLDEILSSAENAFSLKDDIEVKFLCKVDFYPPHGAVRLVVESIDPVYTLGKIAQERQKLIARLRDRGIFEKNKALPLPLVPVRVGLITAFDSAAYNDFVSELRLSGFGFQVFHRNSLMQGKKAEGDICEALKEFNAIEDLDVIVITRGGGSIAELSCFDSEALAEKIAESRLPVLCGIGHEINVTVMDLAAHTYQKTPTAIAHFLVERVEDFLMGLEERSARILRLALDRMDSRKRALHHSALALQNAINFYLKGHSRQMTTFQDILNRGPFRILKSAGHNLEEGRERLLKIVKVRLQNEHNTLREFQRITEMASLERTLKRGFSITRKKSGELIRKIKDVPHPGVIQTQLMDGVIESRVDHKDK